MASLIQTRRDISTNWSSVNPILAHGEMGYDVTLNRLKVGNGVLPWNTLPWLDFDITQSLNLLDLGIPDGTNGQVLSTNGSASFQFVDLPKDLTDLTDTTGLLTNPVNTSELINDSGFITIAAVPTKTSDLVNDSAFLTAAALPTNVSSFTNDVGYITAAGVPTDISELTDTTSLLTTPAGGNGSIQISSAGEFAAAAGASYDNATSKLRLTNLEVTGTVDGDLIPTTNILQDLGSPTQRWRDLYLSTNTIHLGDATVSVDGDGDLTLNDIKLIDGDAISNIVNNVIGDAPQLLDTLGKLADAIGGDPNFVETVVGGLSTKADITALVAEVAAREAADATLQANVDALQTSLAPVAFSGAYADLTGAPIGMATQAYVDASVVTAVTDLVGSAPATLDSLNELAAALGQDPNFATTVATQFGILQTEDAALQTQIDSIGSTAATTQASLAAEIANRIAADTALQASIDAITTSSGNVTTVLQAALAAESAERIAGDNVLQNALASETAARIAGDDVLHNALASEFDARVAGDVSLQNALASETAARETADATLQTNIDTEGLVRDAADIRLQTNIDLQEAERIIADTALQTNIDTLQASLATVATTGSYSDLIDQPSIPSIAGLATESYVDTAVAGIVNSAPATLDTLNELATALGNDANFATTVATQIGTKADAATTYTKTEVDAAIADVGSNLATVATTGSYNDLADTPTIPSIAGLATESYVDAAVAAGGGSGGASVTISATAPDSPSVGDLWYDETETRTFVWDGYAWIDASPAGSSGSLIPDGAVTGEVLTWDGISWGGATPAVQFSGSYNDLIDTPTIPSVTGLATEVYVNAAISNLIDSAPGALDTLNELAVALGDNSNAASVLTTQVGAIQTAVDALATVATTGSYNDLIDKPGPVIEEPYRGFYAVHSRYSGTDRAFYQIILANTAEQFVFDKTVLNTNDDDFYADGLSTANTVSMFNLYANSSSDVMSLEAIKEVIKAYIDNVLFDGEIAVTDTTIAKQRFVDNFSTITASVTDVLNTQFIFNSNTKYNVLATGANGTAVIDIFIGGYNGINYTYSYQGKTSQTGTFDENEIVIIPGTLLNGISPDNDATITVETDGNGDWNGVYTITGIAASEYPFPPVESINDGGSDVYDTGNKIYTDVTGDQSYLQYNEGAPVTSGDQWGSGSSYVVSYQSGVFCVSAFNTSVNRCGYKGGLGYDGNGEALLQRLIGGLIGEDTTIDLGGFSFKDGAIRNAQYEDFRIQADDDLYLDALGDDLFLRAEGAVRIRPGFDFDENESIANYTFDVDYIRFPDDSEQLTAWPFDYEITNELRNGGFTGQLLSKGDNQNFVWVDAPESGGGASVTVSPTAPSTPATGDLWYDETEARTFVWNGSAWIDASPTTASVTGFATETYVDDAVAIINDQLTAIEDSITALEAGSGGGGGTTLADGTVDGQALIWDAATSSWVAGANVTADNFVISVSDLTTTELDFSKGVQTISVSAPKNFTATGATSGKSYSLTLIITSINGAPLAWPTGTQWPGGTAPTFDPGTHIVTLITVDGGTTFYGVALNGYA